MKAERTPPFVRPNIPSNTPNVLLFSPHPDDECITGGLALRLLRDAKWHIINVAVTLGSKRSRRRSRRRELQNACATLGFELVVAGGTGLEQINPEARVKHPARWQSAVKSIAGILAARKPRVIFLPHENDVHPTHVGTHWLVQDALKTLLRGFTCFVIETEFWGQMAEPNLLVEIGADDLADLVAALSLHVGEVKRNAYHARLPAWMLDNVRRGAELVGGRGAKAPEFTFAAICRLQQWRGGKLREVFNGGKFLSRRENAAKLLPRDGPPVRSCS
ncbi:MAG TPA: PIG-L family deacetylase [Verrucomicrobiae bacterium]|nr:PIG-L family deacetylase [Verrucomicrobiae bacterium]